MTTRFRIEMLPARHGDCLWIEYGDPEAPHRVLIDGGTTGTYDRLRERLLALPDNQRRLELLVVTHIDADHIEGVLKLLEDDGLSVCFGDIWFNGWRHLPGSQLEEFGPVQGERLSTHLDAAGLPWNQSFNRKRVCATEGDGLISRSLPGGLALTLVSPGTAELTALRPVWERECRRAGLDPSQPPPAEEPLPPGIEVMGPLDIDALAASPFEGDHSAANGSSIALLAEFDGRRALLAGDAYAEVLLAGIQRLTGNAPGQRLRLDAFKVPHHGSKANLNRELLDRLECPRFLISTDGTRFRHPDREAIARIVKFSPTPPELVFNYRTEFNAVWDQPRLMNRHAYRARYPADGEEGLVVDL